MIFLQVAVIFLCLLGIASSFIFTVVFFKDRDFIENLVLGFIMYIFSHILSSIILFTLDIYKILYAVLGAFIIDFAMMSFIIIKNKPFKRDNYFDKSKFSIYNFLIPIICLALSTPFVMCRNEFFGMGQDEGVYETQAISFIEENTKRQKDFSEYYKLEDKDKGYFEETVKDYLVGYDIPPINYPKTVYDETISPVSGIYHGIPTYSSLLATCGMIFGIRYMTYFEIPVFYCLIFLVYLVCRNFQLKKITTFFACLAVSFSPVVLWVAKASLTEIVLTIIVATYVYFITDEKHKNMKWLSIIPIGIFSCYHVSIFTMIPMFLIIYAGLYLFTREKQYEILMPVTIVIYLISYFVMRHIQPFYTMNNYRNLFIGPINVSNITYVVPIACVIALIATIVYTLIIKKHTKKFDKDKFLLNAQSSKGFQWFLRLLIILPIVYILIKFILTFDFLGEFGDLGISGYSINAGVLLLPIGVVICIFKPKYSLKTLSHIVLFVMFVYCILIYSAVMRYKIDFYYYYGRYLAPYIIVVTIFSLIMIESVGKKAFVPIACIGMIYYIPFDAYLLQNQNETRVNWDVLEDIQENISSDDCVVISQDYAMALWLPVRDMTGADVYIENPDNSEQFKDLSSKYDTVLYLTNESADKDKFSIIYKNKITTSEDLGSKLAKVVSIPLKFYSETKDIQIYEYEEYKYSYEIKDDYERFDGLCDLEDDFAWTDEEKCILNCGLEKSSYTVTINLSNVLSPDMNVDKVKISMNGKKIETEEINYIDNGEVVICDVPKKYVKDGKNKLEIESKIWDASDINAEDDRELGIPIESIVFTADK
jgi:hypothetical protein